MDDEPSRRKPSGPSTVSVTVVRRTSSSENVSSKKRSSGPIAQEALLSFDLPSSSADRPSKSRRLTSLPSVAPTIRPLAATASTTSGSGLFQPRLRMKSGVEAGSDRRHGRGLSEDFRIRPNADFEILAPGPLFDQHGL